VGDRRATVDVVLGSRRVWWGSRYWAESFEAWWDGELVGSSTYNFGMKFNVLCVPGWCTLELLPQHTHGAVQRFRFEVPAGCWVVRSKFVCGLREAGWSTPVLTPVREKQA